MYDYYSLFLRILNRLEFTYLSVINYIPLIGSARLDAAQNVHERRFSRSVFTDQSMNLSLLDRKVYIIQSLYAGEDLGYMIHSQQFFCQSRSLLSIPFHKFLLPGSHERKFGAGIARPKSFVS